MDGKKKSKSNKRKKQSVCFVPRCTTGYKSNKNKLSLFLVPKDLSMQETWSKAIPRADKKLDENCCVCEKHFEPYFIERYYRHIIGGEEVIIPRGKPHLKSDAIPTIFPNLPHYLSKKLPKKRSNRNLSAMPSKKQKLICKEAENEMVHFPNNDTTTFEDLCNIPLPSKYWCKVYFVHNPNVVAFHLWQDYSHQCILPDKRLVVKKEDSDFTCESYLKSMCISTKLVKVESELESILNELHLFNFCEDIGKTSEFPCIKIDDKIIVNGEDMRAKRCVGKVDKKEKRCQYCKYKRKLAINCSNYRKNCKPKTNSPEKLKSVVIHNLKEEKAKF